MSVTSSGPRGFEHQYLATTCLWLEFHEQGCEVYVEHPGEEDATLVIGKAGAALRVEVQGKDHSAPLSPDSLAEILLKFPSHSAQDSLLSRLVADEDRRLLVTLSGRLQRELEQLRLRWPEGLRSDELIAASTPRRAVSTLIWPLLGSVSRGERQETLREGRAAHVQELLDTLDVKRLQAVLRRVHIIEDMSESRLRERGRRILSQGFLVPFADTRNLLSSMEGAVGAGRGTSESVHDKLDRLASLASAERVDRRDRVSIVHPDHDSLLAGLVRTGVALVTGPSLSGKSHVVRSIASNRQRAGVHVLVTSGLDAAQRFMEDPAEGEDRLVLLEDPLGGWEPHSDIHAVAQDLEALVLRASCGRAIVATAKDTVLARADAATGILHPALAGHPWRTLGHHPGHVIEVFDAHANDLGLDSEVVDAGRSWLESVDWAAQPGHARQLAYALRRDLSLFTHPEQLQHRVQVDAQTLEAQLWERVDARPILQALAWTTTTLTGPREIDLAAILDEAHGSGFGLMTAKQRPYVRVGKRHDPAPRPNPPEYPASLALSSSARSALSELEERGYITWVGDRVVFVHPMYQQAVYRSLLRDGRFVVEQAGRLLRKAAASLDPVSATNAIYVLHNFTSTAAGPIPAHDAVESGLLAAERSYFPAVADAGLALASRSLSELSHIERASPLSTAIGLADRMPPVLWEPDGSCWFDPRERSWTWPDEIDPVLVPDGRDPRDVLLSGEGLSPDVLEKLIEELDGEAWSDAHRVAAEAALSRPEIRMRAPAAELVARLGGEVQSALFRRAAQDRHPVVVARAVRGLIRGWHGREVLCWTWLQEVRTRLTEPVTAALVAQDLANFRQLNGWDDDWYHGRSAAWNAWAVLAAQVLPQVPPEARLNGARLHDVAKDAVQRTDIEYAILVISAWQDWVELLIDSGVEPDDWTMSTASLLMRVESAEAEHRAPILERLLRTPHTSGRQRVAQDLLLRWSRLDPIEQRLLHDFVHADRPDRRWMRGLVLSMGEDAPVEIVRPFLPAELAWPPTAAQFAHDWPIELFADVLLAVNSLHAPPGHRWPAPIWWEDALFEVLADPDHPTFTHCLEAAITTQGRGKKLLATLEDQVGRYGPWVLAAWYPCMKWALAFDPLPSSMLPLWEEASRHWNEEVWTLVAGDVLDAIDRSRHAEYVVRFARGLEGPQGQSLLHEAVDLHPAFEAIEHLSAMGRHLAKNGDSTSLETWSGLLCKLALSRRSDGPLLLPFQWEVLDEIASELLPADTSLHEALRAGRSADIDIRSEAAERLRPPRIWDGWVHVDGQVGEPRTYRTE